MDFYPYRWECKKCSCVRAKHFRIKNYDKLKAYRIANKTKRNKQSGIYQKHKYKTDLTFRIKCILRSRVRKVCKNIVKRGSGVSDLGCSVPEFRKYIESQFSEGMTWQNYGEWHLDHIVPLSKFNLQDRQQFLIACNYSNMQPMWSNDNLKKHDTSILDYRDGFF